jgi:acetoin utilization protein AcuB
MYVGRIMHTDLITVSPNASLVEANELVEKHGIDHLLVVNDEGTLVGLLSDRDLKRYWASPATTLSAHELSYVLEKLPVRIMMIKTIVTVSPDTTIERAAFIMQNHNINSLPVMENGKLLGIITSTDVMDVLLEAIGMQEDSVRLIILVQNRIGTIAEITALLSDNQINIESLITWPMRRYPGVHQLVVRLSGEDGPKAVAVLNRAKFKVMTRYVEDLTPYLPEGFAS